MSDFALFVPNSKLTAQQNLNAFVAFARDRLTVFGPDLDFENDFWDVTSSVTVKGEYNKVTLCFVNQESTRRTKVSMQEPFRSFAKAYMRYQFGLAKLRNIREPLIALRSIEFVLRSNGGCADPTAIDAHVLNQAVDVSEKRLTPGSAYNVGLRLAQIARFLRANQLTTYSTVWKNPLKRPSDHNRVGSEYDEERASKFPTPTVFDALPRIFREATEPGDILTASSCALMCSAPDRINEVVLLREACGVEKKDSQGESYYGLRFWPSKGAAPLTKWIPNSMRDVAKEAVEKIRLVTSEGRKIAAWYERFPDRLFLSDHLSHLRSSEWLTLEEIGDVVFLPNVSRDSIRQWCEQNEVELHKLTNRSSRARFADVERAILDLLPPGFPIMNEELGLKYSEALFVCRRNEINEHKTTYQGMFEPLTRNHVGYRLRSKADGPQSIFDRFGFVEPDGSRVCVTSRQFRHYLNTLAQAGGLSQLDIAKWSGRKDIRQNAAYDHPSNESLLIEMRKAIGDEKCMVGPLSDSPSKIISRDQFSRLKIPTAHTTDLGYCVHDYVMSPCQLNLDCINCDELICVKGKKDTEEKIRRSLAEAELLASTAQMAVLNGDFGADEWLTAHLEKVKRLRMLVEIFENPLVLEGAFINLAASGRNSKIELAHTDRSNDPVSVLGR